MGAKRAIKKPGADKDLKRRPAARSATEHSDSAKLRQARAETAAALAREAATAEILKVISSSPTDVQPVFEAIAASAKHLFRGQAATVTRVVGDMIHIAALTVTDNAGNDAVKSLFPAPLSSTSVNLLSRVAHSGVSESVSDTEAAEIPLFFKEMARVRGYRSILAVPMLHEGVSMGTISVTRREPGPFTDHHIGLLKTFADQAVIAIENVRLFNETKEALEQQTATAEILRVISSSPTDTQPVFDCIVRSVASLCEAPMAGVILFDGAMLHLAASNFEAGLSSFTELWPMPIERSGVQGIAVRERSLANVKDVESDARVADWARPLYRANNIRSGVWVPMLREGNVVGLITAFSHKSDGFGRRSEELLKTFADQAVIAIENVRLFKELEVRNKDLGESLEQQTATADILRVISSSPTDTKPVFDAIAESAARLFDPATAAIFIREGDLIDIRGYAGPLASKDSREKVAKLYPMRLSTSVIGWCVREKCEIRIADTEIADADCTPEAADAIRANAERIRDVGRAGGHRSFVMVPLIRGGQGIGVFVLTHPQVGFSSNEKQSALIRTFADQAVIAIENVRLFNETKEALERQTATAEILRVIASSPSNVQPVFDTIAANALRLCDASFCIVGRFDGELIHLEAMSNVPGEVGEEIRRRWPLRPDTTSASGRAVQSREVVEIPDILADPAYQFADFVKMLPYRSSLAVPMLREGVPVGVISISRDKVGSFPPNQISVLNLFASQAVIAIENVRLFNETKEALERQTATAEILKVISGSPTDTQPVFEEIVQSAARLFVPWNAAILMREGNLIYRRALTGPRVLSREEDEIARNRWPMPFDPEKVVTARVIADVQTVQILDTEAPDVTPGVKETGRAGKYRSIVWVPLVRDGEGIGSIVLTHAQAGYALSEKQLALIRTFADQAVIAIENVRLFKELQSRTEALTKSVGQLMALGEVGQAISSTLDLETVLQTIVTRAVQLTGLDGGSIYEYDERTEELQLQAAENMTPDIADDIRKAPTRKGDGALGRTALTLEPTQVPDTLDESYQSGRKDLLVRAGTRALLAVPLLREGHLLGAILVNRRTPGTFAPEVVELLKTFATQSAMAIQNARLFREIEEKGKQLEVASRHKSDFLASMSHELRTPLNAILGFNEMILDQVYGEVSADVRTPLENMQSSGRHLLRLINNVLDLAKIEAGRMELSLQDYSAHDVVESVRATLRPLAESKGLALTTSVPADLPLGFGDPGRLMQCLMNLAGNSLKFTKEGRVDITVELNGDALLLYRVADTGIGIPPDKIGSLFTEFKQTDATIASEYGGTGLGLSISKKFVEMHGGRIWIESEIGKGSTFLFEVPLRVAQ